DCSISKVSSNNRTARTSRRTMTASRTSKTSTARDESQTAILQSRAAFLIVAILLMAIPIGIYARERWLAVVTLLLSDGLLVAGWVVCAWLLGKRFLGRRVGEVNAALKFATCVGLGLGVMSLCALGMGLAGWLSKWTAALLLLTGPL